MMKGGNMGWIKIATLTERKGTKTVELWHRHGLDGVHIEIDGSWYNIPKKLLINMAADHIREVAINTLEQIEGNELLKRLSRWL